MDIHNILIFITLLFVLIKYLQYYIEVRGTSIRSRDLIIRYANLLLNLIKDEKVLITFMSYDNPFKIYYIKSR